MNTATDLAQEGWIGPDQRISMMVQLRGAFGRVRRAWAPLAVLALGTCILALGGQEAATALGIHIVRVELSPAYLAYAVSTTLLSSLLSVMALRVLVRGREGWLSVDGPLLIGAGLLSGFTLAILAMNGVLTRMVQAPATDNAGFTLAMVLAAMVGYVALLYGSMKLALWPIGIILQRPDVTPARSWRLMKKATRGLLLGYVVLALPLVAVSAFGARLLVTDLASGALTPVRIVPTVLGVAFAYLGSGLVATIYDLRVTRRADVAQVFD